MRFSNGWLRTTYYVDTVPFMYERQVSFIGRYQFMFATAPSLVEGGTGSPLNPLAIF
jgi:hypothetical protein